MVRKQPLRSTRQLRAQVVASAPVSDDSESEEELEGDDDALFQQLDEDEEVESIRKPKRSARNQKNDVTVIDGPESNGLNNNSQEIIENSEEDEDATGDDWNQSRPSKNTLRVLNATDNHLGFLVNDPVRGNDSFRAMEEIFQLAHKNHADILLLGGDLFHLNKPCRKTMHETLRIFRKYVLGQPRNDYVKVVSEQKVQLSRDLDGKVNSENPNLNIKLPVFIIHGNHDDPTRDGTDASLSAVDILQMAGLVNYFGAQEEVENITIDPVLIKKNRAQLALYGLGWIRDERLNRLFSNGKVKFNNAAETEALSKGWFNMFMVHQNRQNKGRGTKNCMHESFIPPFFDLVVFGHEHECRIDFEESISGNYNMCQPGSSVATSLVAGEEIKKHVLLLEITCPSPTEASFRYKKLPLNTVRPFVMKEIVLSAVKELEDSKQSSKELSDLEKQEKLSAFLETHVTGLVQEAKSIYKNENPGFGQKELDSVLPLVKLRVEFSEFSPINMQRFGAKFTSATANPSELISFYKKRKINDRVKAIAKDADGLENSQAGEYEIEETAGDKISALIEEILGEPSRKLKLFENVEFNQALDDYVVKQQSTAIKDFVSNNLEDAKDTLKKENRKICEGGLGNMSKDLSNKTDILNAWNALREKKGNSQPSQTNKSKQAVIKEVKPQLMDFEGMDVDSDPDFDSKNAHSGDDAASKRGRKTQRNNSRRSNAKPKPKEPDLVVLESDEEENQPPKQVSARRKTKTRAGKNKSKSRPVVEVDEEKKKRREKQRRFMTQTRNMASSGSEESVEDLAQDESEDYSQSPNRKKNVKRKASPLNLRSRRSRKA